MRFDFHNYKTRLQRSKLRFPMILAFSRWRRCFFTRKKCAQPSAEHLPSHKMQRNQNLPDWRRMCGWYLWKIMDITNLWEKMMGYHCYHVLGCHIKTIFWGNSCVAGTDLSGCNYLGKKKNLGLEEGRSYQKTGDVLFSHVVSMYVSVILHMFDPDHVSWCNTCHFGSKSQATRVTRDGA